MLPVILTVYLNDSQQMLTEAPVTPATRVMDVVEYCKEAGEGECHLAEVWSGHGLKKVLRPPKDPSWVLEMEKQLQQQQQQQQQQQRRVG
ncbi:hypothetical protein CRUP_008060 [Coryphaenoides rupestris]|nr:hypothetical protein CRUP_008060 [Coryphaenoides rupestris]